MIMMIIFCYFNFLNKAAMVNLGIMYESIIFFICPGMPNILDYHF